MLIHKSGWCSKTHLGVQRVSQSNSSLTYLLTTFKGSTSLIISVSSSESASSSQSSSTIQSIVHRKMFCPQHSQASAQGAPCMFAPLFLSSIFPHTLFETWSPKLHKLVIATNFLCCTVLMLYIQFLPGVQHSRLLTNHPLILLKLLLSPCRVMAYIFPDPGLFIHLATAAKYIELWLRVRDAWFMHVAKEPFFALSNQSWCTFLSIDNTMPEKGETKAVHCHQEVLDTILPKSNMYPGVESRVVQWGQLFGRVGSTPQECCFLRMLSKRFCGSYMRSTSFVNCSLWTITLVKIWTYWMIPSYLRGKSGFCNVSTQAHFDMSLFPPKTLDWLIDFNEHFRFITGLYFVMKSWKGDKPTMLANNLSDLSPNTAMELEKVVAKFYCQQFFNYFGCTAQVPHCLFVIKSN